MSIYVNSDTRVIVTGITGTQGLFHTRQMLDYGTNIVAGVTPGKGGTTAEGVPVYNTVRAAKSATGANAAVIYVPPKFAADSIIECSEAGIELVVCITEGIPTLDMLTVKRYIKERRTRLIGPNCPGIITPDECKLGIMPGFIHKRGHIGVVSRSGTLTYEAVHQLSMRGIGQSTAIGIGGDPVSGTDFLDVMRAFNDDDETLAVVMIGEIGGIKEETAAHYIRDNMKKPVVAFIAGKTAPRGKRMGHAGAIISGGRGDAASKVELLRSCGIAIAETPDKIGETLEHAIRRAGIYDRCV